MEVFMSVTKAKSSPAVLLNGDTFKEPENPFEDTGENPFETEPTQAQEEYEELKEQAEANGEEVEITQIWKQTNKNKGWNDNFVSAFTNNLLTLSNIGLGKSEFRVVAYILTIMEYGNLINVNQASIGRFLDISRANMSHIFSKLKKKEILVEDDQKNLYMNSNLFAKGMKHRLDKERRDNLYKAQKNGGNFNQSFT